MSNYHVACELMGPMFGTILCACFMAGLSESIFDLQLYTCVEMSVVEGSLPNI